MTERVQIIRADINVQLGLCTPWFFSTSPHDGFFMQCSVLPSYPQLWYDYKQMWIYVIIFAFGWFLWCCVCVFFVLICEDKQLWSWDGAEELYNGVLFMTLRGWVYSIGHPAAVEERSSSGVDKRLFTTSLDFLLFVCFRGEDEAALGLTAVHRFVFPSLLSNSNTEYNTNITS